MKYSEWLETVPNLLVKDPIWKLEVYRLALFVGDIGQHDVVAISKQQLMYSVADQLHRSLNSISANITEGYSRSKGLDRARFLEIALGSARESRDWYYKSKQVLSPDVLQHRMELLSQIIAMLVPMISNQRNHAIREKQTEYITQPSNILADTEIPLP